MAQDIYDDHEQGERVRKWLSENGSSIIIGLMAALAAVYGWQKYENFTVDQRIQAAQTYDSFTLSLDSPELSAAQAQLDQLDEHYQNNLYSDLAKLQYSAKLVDEGELESAATVLDALRASEHTGINGIATLRLARVRAAQEQSEQALSLLGELPASTELEAVIAEIRGDALLQLGRLDEARSAYDAAVSASGGNPHQALNLKLEKLAANTDPDTATNTPTDNAEQNS